MQTSSVTGLSCWNNTIEKRGQREGGISNNAIILINSQKEGNNYNTSSNKLLIRHNNIDVQTNNKHTHNTITSTVKI